MKLTGSPILAIPNFEQDSIVEISPYSVLLRAVLSQLRKVCRTHLIQLASHAMKSQLDFASEYVWLVLLRCCMLILNLCALRILSTTFVRWLSTSGLFFFTSLSISYGRSIVVLHTTPMVSFVRSPITWTFSLLRLSIPCSLPSSQLCAPNFLLEMIIIPSWSVILLYLHAYRHGFAFAEPIFQSTTRISVLIPTSSRI